MTIHELTERFYSIFGEMFVGCEHHFPLLVIDRDVVMVEKSRVGFARKNDVLRLRFIANDRNIRAGVAKTICEQLSFRFPRRSRVNCDLDLTWG